MTFDRILTRGAALAVLGVALGLPAPVDSPWSPTVAQAQAITISIGTFYDRLSPYGEWVYYRGTYVWAPTAVGPGWQPYVYGHWEYTQPYGWMWVSDEPYAWAVYHYGRWGFDPVIGWYWVPDTVWGPAWVDWRYSDDDVAWAPLPPTTIGFSFGAHAGELPINYWVAVPVTGFLSVDLRRHAIYRDHDRLDRILKRTRYGGRVKVENNIVINNIINVNFIEKKTNKKVRARKVERVAKLDQAGKIKGDEIAIFAPQVEKKGDAKPKKAKQLEEVVKERRAKRAKEAAVEEQEQTGGKARKAKEAAEELGGKKGRKAKEAAVEEQEQIGNKERKAKEAAEEQMKGQRARKAKEAAVEQEERSGKKARKAKEAVEEKVKGNGARRPEKARTTEEPPAQPAGKAKERRKKQESGLAPANRREKAARSEQRAGGKKAERQAEQGNQLPGAPRPEPDQKKRKKRDKERAD